MFGVFVYWVNDEKVEFIRGLDDVFYVLYFRYIEVKCEDVEKVLEFEILFELKEVGVFIVVIKDRRKIFIIGYMEYDRNMLKDEYIRDKEKGLDVDILKNYFKNDDVNEILSYIWRVIVNIVFGNWLNYCVY